MPKKGHTEEQIVAVLRQAEAGEKVSHLCRKVGISEATYYAWKKQYARLGVSELRELQSAARLGCLRQMDKKRSGEGDNHAREGGKGNDLAPTPAHDAAICS
jgi:transposase-like protein